MTDALSTITTLRTSQQASADPRQAKNHAGGYTFTTEDEARVQRFLTLGITGGTFYVGEKELARDESAVIIAAANQRGEWLVEQVRAISLGGRAPKQLPGLFALAVASGSTDEATRRAAFAALPAVARTASTLYTFVGYMENFRGWGRAARNGVGGWFTTKEADQLAYQLTKYRQRDGWSSRDLLRLSHPNTGETRLSAVLDWATKGHVTDDTPDVIHAFYALQRPDVTVEAAVELIADNPIAWEMIPDRLVNEPAVLSALVRKGMPQTALLRNLPRLTRAGVLVGDVLEIVEAQIQNSELLQRGRVHPINVLVAQKTYAEGRSLVGSSTWTPIPRIIDALDGAFYASYGAVEPSGKRLLVALDVSGSMATHKATGLTGKKDKWGRPEHAPSAVTCRDVAGALALVVLNTEPNVDIVGFTSGGRQVRGWGYADPNLGAAGVTPLTLSSRQRLDDAVRYMGSLEFGGTDCAAPALWAAREGKDYDAIVIVTDNETWQGAIHPHQALRTYRNKVGHAVRQIVVSLTPSEFTIADPSDKLSLDVSGFDAQVPTLISNFSAGRI